MHNSLKDRVLEAVDIVDVVGERVHLTRRGKDYVGLCPFHPDHHPSLSVSPSKQIFKCWACGAGGDAIRFVQLADRLEFHEALGSLARRAGVEVRPSTVDREAEKSREELLAAVAWASEHFQRNLETTWGGRRARQYALDRGLRADTIARYGLGFAADARDDLLRAGTRAGLTLEVMERAGLVIRPRDGTAYDRFRNRLMFPIRDRVGRVIAFGGRTLADDPAKYLNSPETPLFSKSRVLYGLDLAWRAIAEQSAAIVVEGYMDVLMLSQFGFQHALATLGTALTDAHLQALRPLARTLYLCFDGDDAGVRAAARAAAAALRTQAEVRVVLLGVGEDPADCLLAGGAERFRACLNGSVDALEFKWLQTLKAYGRADQRGRRRAIEEFIEFVGSVALGGGVDPLEQNLLVGRLGELLGVPPEEIFGLLARHKQALARRSRPEAAEAEASEYQAHLRGLPGGLITAAECVLGLLATRPQCWQWVDDTVRRAVEHSETWRRLYAVLLELRQKLGQYSIREVVLRCDDSALCELVSRACVRVAGAELGAEAFVAVRDRLACEDNILRMADLRQELRAGAAGESGEDVWKFRRLCEIARGQHSVQPAERRWNALPPQ